MGKGGSRPLYLSVFLVFHDRIRYTSFRKDHRYIIKKCEKYIIEEVHPVFGVIITKIILAVVGSVLPFDSLQCNLGNISVTGVLAVNIFKYEVSILFQMNTPKDIANIMAQVTICLR